MRFILLASVTATLAIAAGACSGAGDPYPPPATGGSTGAGTGGAASGGAATGGTAGAATGGAASGGAAAVSYAKDLQPILKAKCGTCHGGQSLGQQNIATVYDDAKKPVHSLQFDECWQNAAEGVGPKTIGECSYILANNGKMPYAVRCDTATPVDPASCLTQAEKDIFAKWIAAGMPP